MSKFLKITALGLGATLLLGLSGCSMDLTERRPVPAPIATSDSEPSDSVDSTDEEIDDATATSIPVTAEDLALASSSTVPLTAVSGRYIVVEGYDYFDTLTVLEFDSGEKAYFATSGGAPFGNVNAGMAIAADQASRDLTGFGDGVPADGPAGLDAAKMLSDHKSELG